MREFMVAVLEDNNKSQRTVGFSDADIIEVLEQSVEIMTLVESVSKSHSGSVSIKLTGSCFCQQLNKRATFTDIVNFMMKKAKENAGRPSGGGGCCGDDGGPPTPDSIITKFLPKLIDTVLEILCEAPFNGEASLSAPNGDKYKFKGESILKTVLAFTLRVLGGRLQQKRKISIETNGPKVSVTCEKLPFLKEDPHSGKRRSFIALVNTADYSMYVQEISSSDVKVTKDFKMKEGKADGENQFKAFVVSGDGQIDAGSSAKAVE